MLNGFAAAGRGGLGGESIPTTVIDATLDGKWTRDESMREGVLPLAIAAGPGVSPMVFAKVIANATPEQRLAFGITAEASTSIEKARKRGKASQAKAVADALRTRNPNADLASGGGAEGPSTRKEAAASDPNSAGPGKSPKILTHADGRIEIVDAHSNLKIADAPDMETARQIVEFLNKTPGINFVDPENGGKEGKIHIAFEMKLKREDFGKSSKVHFNRANEALHEKLTSDPEFARMMEMLIPGVTALTDSRGRRKTPPEWTWHHSIEEGIMQLVPRSQHQAGGIYHKILHPGGKGGYDVWAIPNGAPPRRTNKKAANQAIT